MPITLPNLTPAEVADFGFARAKDIAFDAVHRLWKRREEEGWQQQRIAEAINWDPALVSRKLQGPGNWTLRTLGSLAEALNGELHIDIVAADDPLPGRKNYHAYSGYEPPVTSTTLASGDFIDTSNPPSVAGQSNTLVLSAISS